MIQHPGTSLKYFKLMKCFNIFIFLFTDLNSVLQNRKWDRVELRALRRLEGGDILPESLEYICFLCKSFQQASGPRLFSKENEDSKFSSHLDIYPFISYAFLRTKYLISLTFILQFGYSKILKSQANTICVPFLLIKNNVNLSKIIAYHFLYILSASVIL